MKKDIKQSIVYQKSYEDDFGRIEGIYNQEVVGYLTYKIDYKTRSSWLYKVAVPSEYRTCGIGSDLMAIYENECCLNRLNYIEGKFYPEGEDGDKVRTFYENRGYSVYKDGYETYVGKSSLSKQDLSNLKIEEKITEQEKTQ